MADLARCYWPGGTQVDSHTPCNESAPASHCCVSSDACISNGYCFQQGNAEQWVGEGYALALLLVNNTANGSFCCSNGYDPSTNQCNMVTRGSNKAFQIQPGQVIWDRRTGSTETPVNGSVYATVREVSTSTVTSISTAGMVDQHKMVTIVVGVVVPLGALLILAVVSLVLMWRRLKAVERIKNVPDHQVVDEGFLKPPVENEEAYQLPDNSIAKHEAETDAMRHELVNEIRPVEVSAVQCCEVEGDVVERRRRL
ncbi:hypothetical protein PRZ48_009424 [Zasmidium cellare]|uniref:Uncharacterized protein n=1 Tax=Zasmidium cellare TaxID=395010 RepID=A0ABR0EC28_ZASCE|nr:hypothetical protein PRZ48_009424 [Zasmidium cellare]